MASEKPLQRRKRIQDIRNIFQSLALARQTSKPSRLTSLPREIHLKILEQLSPASQLSLGLTCKELWPVVHDENTGDLRVPMTGDDKYEFLGLLSIDCPRYLACYGCKVLHRRYVDEFWCINTGRVYKLCDETRAAFPAPCLPYTLSYEMLDLALRFDELSSDHGVPLTLLSHQSNLHDLHVWALPCKVEVLPRICEGRLLLRIDTFIKFDCIEALGDQVERLHCLPCIHMLRPVFELHCSLNLRMRSSQWCAMPRCDRCATDASTRLVCFVGLTVLLVRVWKDFGGRGGCGKQPWTGHVTGTLTSDDAVCGLGAKHLGHVFDGEDDVVEMYDKELSLAEVNGCEQD